MSEQQTVFLLTEEWDGGYDGFTSDVIGVFATAAGAGEEGQRIAKSRFPDSAAVLSSDQRTLVIGEYSRRVTQWAVKT